MIQSGLVALVALQALAFYFAVTPETTTALLPLRLVVGSAATLFLPGALAALALRGRSRHFLETLAVGAFGSFLIVALLGLAAMALRVRMSAVVFALIAINAILTAICLRQRDRLPGLVPRSGKADWLLFVLLAALGVLAYRWGDDVRAVGWELALHLGYVRQYASPLPLGFDAAVLRPPEIIAQNYLYLWEFVLAAIARMSGVDPLVAALKSRWLMPVLGFASFFFMAQRVTASTAAAARATWVMLAAVLLQFLTLAPNAYETYIESGPLRQVGAFLGSIHHSDSAMEILLPLLIGLLFWAIRRGTAAAWGGFAAGLVVAFLWHPREYLQVMWYGAIAMLVDLIAGGIGSRRAWRRRGLNYVTMVACYAAVAAVLYLGLPSSIRSSPEHTAGATNQWQTLLTFLQTAGDWRTWGSGSLPFAFHLHGYEAPGIAPSDPMVFSWLVVAVPAAIVLAFAPRRRVRWIALYLLVLWLTSLCSYKFEQLMQAVTYHEILISKPRIVHLFAYIVIGLGWSRLLATTRARGAAQLTWIRTLGVAAAGGAVFALAWKAGAPKFVTMFAVLNVAFFAAAALLVWSLRARRGRSPRGTVREPSALLAGLSFAVFVLPVCVSAMPGRWAVMLGHHLDPAALFGMENPLELSAETLTYFRTVHPPRQRLLVEPNRPYMVAIYAPVYVMPLLGNIGADSAQFELARQGKHPVFGSGAGNLAPAIDAVQAFLRSNGIAYLLGTAGYVPRFVALAERYPHDFAVTFLSTDRSNVVLHYLADSRSP